jgi:hypothetical protein
MKMPTLLVAVALACGSAAFAAGNTSDHATTNRDQSAAVSSSTHDSAKGEGFVAKTKRAFHRMGDKLRSMGHKNETQQAKDRDDTRAMGAGGSDAAKDGARQQRMDQAYADYQSKQKK